MRHIHIIGIGAGDPAHLTLAATRAIAGSDVFFLFDKGQDKAQLTALRTGMIEAHKGGSPFRLVWGESPEWSSRGADYAAIVGDLNARKTRLTGALFDTELKPGETGAILVWGDPALYDSTIRIVRELAADDPGLEWDVLPGISSMQALTARHRICLNTVGGAVEITTGRRLAAGLPDGAETIIVMLDAQDAFLRHVGAGLTIHYGAYLGLAQEQLFHGPLDGGLAAEIADYRRMARDRHGWIMDSYLLRR